MLMIRFQRIGRKNDPAFRIVVLEKTSGPKAGKYTDLVGTYNPKTKAVTLQPERIKDWMAKGAQVSPSLHNLLVSQGVIEGKKMNVLPKKTAPVKETPAPAEAAPAAAPAAEAAPAPEAAAEAPAEEAAPEAAMPSEAEVEAEAVEAPAEEAAAVPAEEAAPEAEAEAAPAEEAAA